MREGYPYNGKHPNPKPLIMGLLLVCRMPTLLLPCITVMADRPGWDGLSDSRCTGQWAHCGSAEETWLEEGWEPMEQHWLGWTATPDGAGDQAVTLW